LNRYLKEKAKELRQAQEEREGTGEDGSERETGRRKRRKKHRERSSDVERERGTEDHERRKKYRDKSNGLDAVKEVDPEEGRTSSVRRAAESLDSKNRVNYPSWAARKRAAGKYDALGI
jgi:hypothetical protein